MIYLVFDGDADKKPKDRSPEINLALQALCGELNPTEHPHTGARERYAVFERNLTRDMPVEFGQQRFYSTLDRIASGMGWRGDEVQARKNAVVLETVIRELQDDGYRSQTLVDIAENVKRLRASHAGVA